ncbi:MAG: 3-dehydroquinate synthase [Selenomonadaceae bacterium]|nr:3-dehydroquinate synthase [Selenomonadaceae bacterium]
MDIINIHSNLYDYTVEFVNDFSGKLMEFDDSTTYIIDKNVYELYKEKFKELDKKKIFFVNAVESEKNMDTVMRIISFFQELGVRKNWSIVCFGGGITQDLTTIASNLFLRNVNWYFFPTTLLSMCDSCIGGKCGINYRHIKNQIGVFYPPKKIFIDTHFLNTLTKDDYINGWGEILKFSLTSDEKFYNDLQKEEQYIPCPKIAEYIHRGLFEKKKIIEADEFESDLRRVLNYGHTFGHALEAYTNNRIPHGTAVIWGIDVVNYIAVTENLISEEYYLSIKNLIKNAFITEEIEIAEPNKLFDIIKTDKKVKGNVLSFAMLDKPSHLVVYPMTLDDKLRNLFCQYLEKTHEYYNH